MVVVLTIIPQTQPYLQGIQLLAPSSSADYYIISVVSVVVVMFVGYLLFFKFQNCFRMFQNSETCFRILKLVSDSFRILKLVSDSFRILKLVSEF
jgi:hypothetical protein